MPDLEAECCSLRDENEELRRALAEATGTLDAIRNGDVDGLVVKAGQEYQVFTLETAERPYRWFVEEMQQGALTLGPAGTMLFCNQRFADMLLRTPEDLVGHPFAACLTPEGLTAWQGLLAGPPQGRAAGELVLLRGDGSALPAFAAISPMPSAPGRGLTLVVSDLTEHKQFERLVEAEHQLLEASRAKDQFLALLGHELRNPLAPLRNAVSLMKFLSLQEPRMLQIREIIDRQVTHLVRLVDDLLEVSRIANGKIILRLENLDLAALVGAVAEDHRPLFEAEGLAFDFHPPGEPLPTRADGARIAQILSNLLVNAGKFTPPGGRVRLSLGLDSEGHAAISITDSGIGMAPETLAHLFEPFRQASKGLVPSTGGLGLGLALAQGLAQLHGGRILAASGGPGQGSEFTLVLPLRSDPGEVRRSAPAATVVPFSRRVLIIEDNPDVAETHRMLLQAHGHQAVVASCGAEGLRLAEAVLPEFILCDIGLTGSMDGYAVAEALRRMPGLESTYLIALTGFSQEEDRHRALEAGFHEHLTKPADPEALFRLLADPHPLHSKPLMLDPSLPERP